MPYYADDWLTVYLGDCREVMAAMPAESVHCVVTSPPYWGLRDYGIGEKGLGLEPTPEAYVEAMVAVFREVRRVLRKDGTVWVNLGDSYAGTPGSGGSVFDNGRTDGRASYESDKVRGRTERLKLGTGLKPKDLVGIPWRVAFALQADGWYLRSDIIWSKPNPMPESVTDRPTKAHEYVFLLSKSPRYYYDADAVREAYANGIEAAKPWAANGGVPNIGGRTDGYVRGTALSWEPSNAGRNLRSVWNIATEPYPGAHFATFPRALVEPCIKAGTSEKGVCPECGAPWEREVEPSERYAKFLGRGFTDHDADLERGMMQNRGVNRQNEMLREGITGKEMVTTGWRSSCAHGCEPVPATVLDPFAGSGTTGLVAQSLSRRAVLIDLSADYLEQLMNRNRDIPLGLAGG